MEDLTGVQLGEYRIDGALGKGGMSSVYRAHRAATGQIVAMKLLPKNLAHDPEFAGRFQQEALVISRLKHPHIVPLLDYGQSGGYSYIVIPFIETGTLADRLQGAPLPIKFARQVVEQVGGALDHAHGQGIVHRDLKPPNVLIDARGDCLLTDFGVAKLAGGSAKLTKTGLAVGTPTYMSPEQGLGQKVDGRADIYALGAMLYQMITGRVPFQAAKPMAVMVMHIQSPVPPPRSIEPSVPESVEQVILRALAKKPEDRFATASEMAQAMHAATAKG